MIDTLEDGKTLSVTWHPGLDATLATRVTVRFAGTDDGKTVVTLIHDGWDMRGDQAEATHENYVAGLQDILWSRFQKFVLTH